MKKSFCSLVLAASLAGCGGGSTGNNSYSELLASKANLKGALRDTRPTAQMPTTGTANYQGYAGYSLVSGTEASSRPEWISNVALAANFGTGRISGTLDGFVDSSGSFHGGRLDLSSGIIASNTIVADVGGTFGGGQANGSIDGVFLGVGATGLSGQLTATTHRGLLNGSFIAARQ